MKPVINDKKCGAGEAACKAIKACPADAMKYVEVAEPIFDREVNCTSSPDSGTDSCGCDSGCCDSGGDTNVCGGNPYSRIIIDYDKCIECGICATECCGSAIGLVE